MESLRKTSLNTYNIPWKIFLFVFSSSGDFPTCSLAICNHSVLFGCLFTERPVEVDAARAHRASIHGDSGWLSAGPWSCRGSNSTHSLFSDIQEPDQTPVFPLDIQWKHQAIKTQVLSHSFVACVECSYWTRRKNIWKTLIEVCALFRVTIDFCKEIKLYYVHILQQLKILWKKLQNLLHCNHFFFFYMKQGKKTQNQPDKNLWPIFSYNFYNTDYF